MAAPRAEERGPFARGVRAVLGGWAALQLAVAQEFGGPQSPEKAAWLAGALQDFFWQNEDLEEEEVEDFLAEVMDNEFDTAVEDGSLQLVSRELVSLFARTRGGAEGGEGPPEMGDPPVTPPLDPPPRHVTPGGGQEEEEEEEEEAMDCGPAPPLPSPDGWTLVRRRR